MLSIVMLMLAQDIVGPPGDEPVAARATITRPRQCRAAAGDDIVVCGTGADSQRIEPRPEWESQPVFTPAARRLSPNKSVSVTADQGNNPFSESPRAMINFRLDF